MRRLSISHSMRLPLLAGLFLIPALCLGVARAEVPEAVQAQIAEADAALEEAREQRMQNDIEAARRLDFEARAVRLDAITKLLTAGVRYDVADSGFDVLIAQYEVPGYHDLAAEHQEQAVEARPENAALWLALGQQRIALGPAGMEAAFKALMQAQRLNQEDDAISADIAYALAQVYYRRGLYNFAREHVYQAVAQDVDNLEAQVLLAALEAREGAILAASQRLEAQGRALQPLDAETRILLRESLAHFDRTRRTFPDTAEQHFAYARLLYRAGRIHEAVLALQRCTTLEPEDIETWNFLAAIHMQVGNYPASRDAYARSLELNPDQPQIRSAYDQLVSFLEEMAAAQAEAAEAQGPVESSPITPGAIAPENDAPAPIPLR